MINASKAALPYFYATSLTLILSGCGFLSTFGDQDLTEFKPTRQGEYFPGFLKSYFPNIANFEELYPSPSEAADGFKIIEIKRLTKDNINNHEANLSWSEDSVYFGYELVTNKDRKIMVKDLAGDYESILHINPNKKNPFLTGVVNKSIQSYNAGLKWSKDSTRFVFSSNGGQGEFNLYMGGINFKEKNVTQSKHKEGYPSWSPDGREIAYVSSQTGNGDIYVLNSETLSKYKLTDNDSIDIFPAWANKGHTIVFNSGTASNHQILSYHRSDPESEKWIGPQYLTESHSDLLRPTVSPSGNLIAFYKSRSTINGSKRSTVWDIAIIPISRTKTFSADEIDSMTIAFDVVIDLNTGPTWSPDGKKILYVKNDPINFNPIVSYDISNGNAIRLETGTKMNRDIIISNLGIMSFRAQVGAWDKVFLALTNQGLQLQDKTILKKLVYKKSRPVKLFPERS